MGPFGIPPEAQCCCGQAACVGCCVPLADGTNAPQNIPFEISAPGCPELDGWSSVFVPVAPPTSQPLSACGACGEYAAQDLTPGIAAQAYNPPDPCVLLTPPSYTATFGPYQFNLRCDEGPPPAGTSHLDSCCRRLLLAVNWPTTSSPERVFAALSCSCEGGLSAIFPLDQLIEQTWDDPGIFCPIDGQFPFTCNMGGATLVI